MAITVKEFNEKKQEYSDQPLFSTEYKAIGIIESYIDNKIISADYDTIEIWIERAIVDFKYNPNTNASFDFESIRVKKMKEYLNSIYKIAGWQINERSVDGLGGGDYWTLKT